MMNRIAKKTNKGDLNIFQIILLPYYFSKIQIWTHIDQFKEGILVTYKICPQFSDSLIEK